MSEATKWADKPASISTDLGFAALVGLGAAIIVAILPLNWIPLIGPHLPGVGGGVVGALYYVRARWNNPLNL